MGISEIIDSASNGVIAGITIAVIVFVVVLLIIYAVIPIGTIALENKEEIAEEAGHIVEEVEDVAETVKDVAPQIFEAAQTICELDETVLSQLRPNTIESYMLNNVDSLSRMILENWRDTGEITACELKILEENIDDYYKERLNLKSVSKSIVGCNLVECLEKYKVIENLDPQK